MNALSNRPVVFFLGDVALDEYYEAPYWPKVKEKIIVHSLPALPGGMIANTACVAAKLGVEAHFLAMLNRGSISEKLIRDLEAAGVNTQWMVFDDHLPDSKTIIILTENEHTVFIPTLGIKKLEIPGQTVDFIKNCDYFYSTLSEYVPVTSAGKSSLEILQDIRKTGCKVVFDMDVNAFNDEDQQFLEAVDILFVNEIGFSLMKNKRNEKECIDEILAKGVSLLVVTLGENGCRVIQEEQDHLIPGIKIDVVDVTGAGDTFAGSFIYAYHQWKDPKRAAAFAVGAAARSVQFLGARGGIASADEISEFLTEKGIDG